MYYIVYFSDKGLSDEEAFSDRGSALDFIRCLCRLGVPKSEISFVKYQTLKF